MSHNNDQVMMVANVSATSVASFDTGTSGRPSCSSASISSISTQQKIGRKKRCKGCRQNFYRSIPQRPMTVAIGGGPDSEYSYRSSSAVSSQSSSHDSCQWVYTSPGGHAITYVTDDITCKDAVIVNSKSITTCDPLVLRSPMSSVSSASVFDTKQRYCEKCSRNRDNNNGDLTTTTTTTNVPADNVNTTVNALRSSSNVLAFIKTTIGRFLESKQQQQTRNSINENNMMKTKCFVVDSINNEKQERKDRCYINPLCNGAESYECLSPTSSSSFKTDKGTQSSRGMDFEPFCHSSNSNVLSSDGSHFSLASTAMSSEHRLDTMTTVAQTDDYDIYLPYYQDSQAQQWIDNEFLETMIYQRNSRLFTRSLRYSRRSFATTFHHATKSKSLSSHFILGVGEEAYSYSWPLPGRRFQLSDNEDEFHSTNYLRRSSSSYKRSTSDFNIPVDDLKLIEEVHAGKRRSIFRGIWHGDVMVHVYQQQQVGMRKFWEDVEKLMTIRHENIDLFMGAAFEPPRCYVVTSRRSDLTLHRILHVNQESRNLSFKLSIAQQLAQAIGYLHSRSNRPILVRRLNSKSIFLEPQVVLTLLDYANFEEFDDFENNKLAIPNGFFSYAAPEIFQHIEREDFLRVHEKHFTTSSDTYAYGSLLYEVMSGKLPLSTLSSEHLLATVCAGERENTNYLKAPEFVKELISKCWNHCPSERPTFRKICEDHINQFSTHKRQSSSEPENLHKTSFFYSSSYY